MNERIDGTICKCQYCNKETFRTYFQLNNCKYITCSRLCTNRLTRRDYHKSKLIKKTCTCCGKDVFYKPSKEILVKNPSCSIECANKIRKSFSGGEFKHNLMGLSNIEKYFKKKMYEVNKRAIRDNREVNIDYEYLTEIYNNQNGKCFYSGMELKIEGERNYNSCSIERIDSNIGYIKGNVVLCLLSINVFKNNYQLDDMYKIIDAIQQKRRENENQDVIIR